MKAYIAVAITIISIVAIMGGILIFKVSATSSPERYFFRGQKNYEIGRYQDAINDMNEYLSIDSSSGLLVKTSKNIANAKFIIASSLEKLKKYTLAKESLSQIINDSTLIEYQAEAIISYANISRLLNEVDFYIISYLEKYLSYPKDISIERTVNMLYGYQLLYQKKYDEALSYFLRSDGELSSLGRARVYHSMDEYDRAFEVYEDFIKYYKSSIYYDEVVRTYLIQVPAYANKNYLNKNYTKAIFYYKKIADLFPHTLHSEDALFKIATIYYDEKKYDEAIKYYDSVMRNRVSKLDAEALLYKGLSYFNLDRYEDSFKVLYEFTEKYPENPNIDNAKKYLKSLQDILLAINT